MRTYVRACVRTYVPTYVRTYGRTDGRTTYVRTYLRTYESRGIKDQELDVIGELISNIEGAKVVIDDHRHYGTPLREALNKFMQRVINSVK